MQKLIPFVFLMLILFKHSSGQSLWLQTGFSSLSAWYSFQEHDATDDQIFKPGFQAGTMMEFPVTPIFSVIPGLMLQTKGYSEGDKNPVSQINWKYDYSSWYFDIPVLLNLKIPIKKSGLFIEIGPYAGIGLSGTAKSFENTQEKYTEKDKVKWGKDREMKRMEYGITGGAGAEISRFKFGLHYTYSMRDVAVPDDFVYKNRVLTVFVSCAILRNPNNRN